MSCRSDAKCKFRFCATESIKEYLQSGFHFWAFGHFARSALLSLGLCLLQVVVP